MGDEEAVGGEEGFVATGFVEVAGFFGGLGVVEWGGRCGGGGEVKMMKGRRSGFGFIFLGLGFLKMKI